MAVLAFIALDGQDGAPAAPGPRVAIAEAVKQTLGAGPMRVGAIVRTGRFRYRVAGRLDPSRGYRLCGPITRAPNRHWPGVKLWLEGRRGAYGTLTARGGGCTTGASWFDDHPPTLPFSRRMLGYPPPGAVRVEADGFVNRLILAARPRLRGVPRPVWVELRLSRFGAERGVPHVVANAIE